MTNLGTTVAVDAATIESELTAFRDDGATPLRQNPIRA